MAAVDGPSASLLISKHWISPISRKASSRNIDVECRCMKLHGKRAASNVSTGWTNSRYRAGEYTAVASSCSRMMGRGDHREYWASKYPPWKRSEERRVG